MCYLWTVYIYQECNQTYGQVNILFFGQNADKSKTTSFFSIPLDKSNQKGTSTKEIIRRVYQQRGVSGLFAGLVPRVSKVAPACAVMIASYEYGRHFFSRLNQKRTE